MIRRWIGLLVGLTLIASGGIAALIWLTCRIYVSEVQCAVLIRNLGVTLPADQLVATQPGQKGIQQEVLGPGRHFRNPIVWDWKLVGLTTIPSGDPGTWEWVHSLDERQRDQVRTGTFKFKGKLPEIGVVTRKVGLTPPNDQVVVTRASGYKGILREVLTPGTYKINPYIYEVELHPAVVVPSGFVGVVTNLFGLDPAASAGQDTPAARQTAAAPDSEMVSAVRPLAEPGQRGTLRDVLQPGVYFINPKLQKVTMIEIGFNEYSQIKISESENYRISFPSDTGYEIRVGVTVVWGIDPQHAAETINEFGNVDGVLDKIIGPQLRSICRNIGSTYAARNFIQGEKRELFQKDLTSELQRVCRRKNIEVLLALVREIEVHAPAAGPEGADATEDLKRTIQQSYIAIENQITKDKQREAAAVKAQLAEVNKQVDIARENVAAETRVLVANLKAEGDKQAAEIDAQAALEVATVQQNVAQLEASRTEILGQAKADVQKLKGAAEAEGYRLLVDSFGSARAFNLYTFAENFQPDSIQLFYAGEGTFWTDLSRLEEMSAARIMQMDKPSPHER